MNKIFIFLLISVFVLSSSFALYNTVDVDNTTLTLRNDLANLATIKLLNNTDNCFKNCYARLEITPINALSLGVIDKTSITTSFKDIKMLGNFESYTYNISSKSGKYYIDIYANKSNPYTNDDWVIIYNGFKITKFAWWNSSFMYNQKVSTYSAVTSNLANYPYYLSVNTQALISVGKMNSSCKDLRIVSSDNTTTLPYEMVSGCNTTTTQVWFLHPNLTADNLSYVYMYYGNPTASDGQNLTALWINYLTVMHFDDNLADTNVIDSAVNYNGSLVGGNTISSTTSGAYGNSFNITNTYYVNMSNTFKSAVNITMNSGNFSYQIFLKVPNSDWSTLASNSGIWDIGLTGDKFSRNYYQSYGNGIEESYLPIGASAYYEYKDSGIVDNQNWNMMANTMCASCGSMKVYRNGINIANTTGTTTPWNNVPTRATIGYDGNGAGYWIGYLDEFRITKRVLSDSEIKMDYMQGTGVYYSFGNETKNTQPPNTPTNLTPINNSIDQPLTLNLSAYFFDSDTSNLSYTFMNENNLTLCSGSVLNNTFAYCLRSGLTAGTDYYFKVNVSDGTYTNISGLNKFTTDFYPQYTYLYPSNLTNNSLNTTLGIIAYDLDSANLNVSFWDINNTLLCSMSQANNTAFLCNYTGLTCNTSYTWYSIISDTILTNTTANFNFTTQLCSVTPPSNTTTSSSSGVGYSVIDFGGLFDFFNTEVFKLLVVLFILIVGYLLISKYI